MENKFSNISTINIGNQIDNSNNKGQSYNTFDNTKINTNINNKVLDGIDMEKLFEELSILKLKLVEKELFIVASSIKDAIETDKKIEKISFLKKAGEKALEIAQQISLPVATIALTRSMGLD